MPYYEGSFKIFLNISNEESFSQVEMKRPKLLSTAWFVNLWTKYNSDFSIVFVRSSESYF